MSNFEDCSLCPTVPIEHGFRRQSKSNNVEETEIHWKLIPITGKNTYTGTSVCLILLSSFLKGLSFLDSILG